MGPQKHREIDDDDAVMATENERDVRNGESVSWADSEYAALENATDPKNSKRKRERRKENENEKEMGRGFEYIEVVRGRARESLPAHECAQCEKFYALNEGLAMSRAKLCDCVSRHRAKFKQPQTPEHFWD